MTQQTARQVLVSLCGGSGAVGEAQGLDGYFGHLGAPENGKFPILSPPWN